MKTKKKIKITIKSEDLSKIRLPIAKRPGMTHQPKKGHGSYNRSGMKKKLRKIITESSF